jgi:PPOX class probable F420-dependent enzyme
MSDKGTIHTTEFAMLDFKSKLGRKVKRHIKDEYFVWFTTVGANLMPQPRPVWFIWDGDSFLIYSQAKAHKLNHLTAHPKVSLHFNTPDEKGEQDVIVILGTAVIDPNMQPANKVPAYLRKYRTGVKALGSNPEEFSREYSVAIRVTPTSMRGW